MTWVISRIVVSFEWIRPLVRAVELFDVRSVSDIAAREERSGPVSNQPLLGEFFKVTYATASKGKPLRRPNQKKSWIADIEGSQCQQRRKMREEGCDEGQLTFPRAG